MCDAVAHGNPGAARRMVSGAGGACGGQPREGGCDGDLPAGAAIEAGVAGGAGVSGGLAPAGT